MAFGIFIVHVLAGAALGLRFKVTILVPAVTLAMLLAAAFGVAHGDQLWSIVVAMMLLGTAVQLGYLVGVLIRAKFVLVRSRQRTAATM